MFLCIAWGDQTSRCAQDWGVHPCHSPLESVCCLLFQVTIGLLSVTTNLVFSVTEFHVNGTIWYVSIVSGLLFNVMFLRFIHVVDLIICLLHFMLNTQQFVYPFTCGWTFDLFLVFVCYEYSCYECLFTRIFAGMCLYFSSVKN